jgi:hypothetical protein
MNEQLYQPSERTLHWKDRSSASNPTIRPRTKEQRRRKHARNLQELEHRNNLLEKLDKKKGEKLRKGNSRDDRQESPRKGNLRGEAGLGYSLLLFMNRRDGDEEMLL